MKINETSQYHRTKKQFIKRRIISEEIIDATLLFFRRDPHHKSLHYKKMNCKKDKNRYSIRIIGTQYRILMNISNDTAYLICVCDHDEYDRRNKGC